MRKVAVLSDIHANLEALEVVLRQTAGMEVYFLGDLVDYGANPNEVIDRIRDEGAISILGNHDYAAISGDASLMNAQAEMSSKWTANILTENNKEFLRGLPRELTIDFEGVKSYFAHGSPDDPLWEYVDPSTHSLLFGFYLGKKGVNLIGLGHTHIPYTVKEQRGTVFNPGSVGQPRDGDWRASYVVLNIEGDHLEIEHRRTPYDAEMAATKIREAGLPRFFADRLSSGT